MTEKLSFSIIVKDFLYNASPFVLTRVVVELGSDYYAMVMLASLDEPREHDYLAATSLIEGFQGITRSTSVSALYYLAFMVGRASGVDVGRLWRTSYLFSILMTTFSLTAMAFSGSIFKKLSQADRDSDIAQDYFYGYMPGFLFTLFVGANQQLLLGLKKELGPKAPWIVLLSSFLQRILYLFLGDLFLFGRFGLPKFGAKGLGLASSVAAFIAWLGLGCYFLCSKTFKPFGMFEKGFHSRGKELFKKGAEIGLSSGVELFHMLVSSVMLGYLSHVSLAAIQPTWRYLHFLIGSAFSFSQIAAISMDKSREEHAAFNNKLYVSTNTVINLSLALFTLAFFLIFPSQFIDPFIDVQSSENSELNSKAYYFLFIGLVTQLLDSVRISSGRVLQGLGYTSVPLFVNGSLMTIDMLAIVGFSMGLDPKWSSQNILIARAGSILLGAAILSLGLWQELQQKEDSVASKISNWASCFHCNKSASLDIKGVVNASTPLVQ